jgi:copper chaperone
MGSMQTCADRYSHRVLGVTMGLETERRYGVEGMTCAHCRAAVAGEVAGVPGVMGVEVELETGRLTVRGQDIDDQAVAAAVAEAGYSLRR